MTDEKEKGETVMVDGKPISIGIPRKANKRDAAFMASIPLGRGAHPDEAANAMLFLACPLSSYISGHTLEVTGGRGI
jgi:3-oxoacyl-[acyl-carrier protein] reductase